MTGSRIYPKIRRITGDVEPGDEIIILEGSGPHANGISLLLSACVNQTIKSTSVPAVNCCRCDRAAAIRCGLCRMPRESSCFDESMVKQSRRSPNPSTIVRITPGSMSQVPWTVAARLPARSTPATCATSAGARRANCPPPSEMVS